MTRGHLVRITITCIVSDDGELLFKMEEVLVPSEDSVSKTKPQDQSKSSFLGSSAPGRTNVQIQIGKESV